MSLVIYVCLHRVNCGILSHLSTLLWIHMWLCIMCVLLDWLNCTKCSIHVVVFCTSCEERVPIHSTTSVCSLKGDMLLFSRAFLLYMTFNREVTRISCDNGCLARLPGCGITLASANIINQTPVLHSQAWSTCLPSWNLGCTSWS